MTFGVLWLPLVTFGVIWWYVNQSMWTLVFWFIWCIHTWPKNKLTFGDLWWPIVNFQPIDVKFDMQVYYMYTYLTKGYIWPLVTFSYLWCCFNQLIWNLVCRFILSINIWQNVEIDLWWPLWLLVTILTFGEVWCVFTKEL